MSDAPQEAPATYGDGACNPPLFDQVQFDSTTGVFNVDPASPFGSEVQEMLRGMGFPQLQVEGLTVSTEDGKLKLGVTLNEESVDQYRDGYELSVDEQISFDIGFDGDTIKLDNIDGIEVDGHHVKELRLHQDGTQMHAEVERTLLEDGPFSFTDYAVDVEVHSTTYSNADDMLCGGN